MANRARAESLDWIICGCESGPGARPCDIDWLRSLRDQCAAAGTSFFLKQAVENLHDACDQGACDPSMHGVPKVAAGTGSKRKPGGIIELPYLDGVQHAAFPVTP